MAGHGGAGGGGAVRSRSRSASRRRKENEKMDRQVLQDLETSMKESSMVLDRRRTGREAGLKEHRRTPAIAREASSRGSMDRGRPSERQSSQQQPLPNSYAGAQAEDGSNSLRGLLNIAQSWIFNHTSRTERSVERSRAIVRKSSRHT